MTANSFGSKSALTVADRHYSMFRLDALAKAGMDPSRLPFSMRVLLENLLRCEDGVSVRRQDIEAIATWDPKAAPSHEIAFMPARVLMQDFTGVPAVVDLASMRDAMQALGGDPAKINPLLPAELVIDHSVQVDAFGTAEAFKENAVLEFERNMERYAFLRWGQVAFRNFAVVPPDTGICHQVNLEYLARVVFTTEGDAAMAYPDTLVGTDSHTTMVNGLGVLGWGVGGIEAEAAMLGQPMSMLIPHVVGFRLSGQLPEGATATDLVLTVTEMLRKQGVVGKFVEFFGPGVGNLPIADRATIANMAPEYGATCGIFPVDAETLRYLKFTGRPAWRVQLVEAYMKEQGLFHTPSSPEPVFSDTLSLDLGTVEPSVAGPKRPQDRVKLSMARASFMQSLPSLIPSGSPVGPPPAVRDHFESEGGVAYKRDSKAVLSDAPPTFVEAMLGGEACRIHHGSVVIAAITSCTNTSNPSVMIAAGLLAKKAVARGLKSKPWVKTSLAPGSKVVSEYLEAAGLMTPLEALGFNLVGYGCTTCIGNSGPLPDAISAAIKDGELVVCSVLSGNRNFEGRVQQDVRANYLMSPPLVVAYALAGRMNVDLVRDPLGKDATGKSVYLKDIWPSSKEIADCLLASVRSEMFTKSYGAVFDGDERWNGLSIPTGDRYVWDEQSTYIKRAPYFDGMPKTPAPVVDIANARVLAFLGDSITTDHISPAGSIKKDGPAGKWLIAHGVEPRGFNSYGSRRGQDEVMVRGTFANVRIKNKLAPGTEGGVTRHLPGGEGMSIYDAAMRYRQDGVPTVVLAGKEYGSGSSRDWAAKGPRLLGIRVVIAESYERIHRSNLVGMGILPLQFKPGQTAESLGLTGEEIFAVTGVAAALDGSRDVTVMATGADGKSATFHAIVRIDTPKEVQYYRHGGILEFVLRQLAGIA
ncbi:MAG TPA: aconitate hydratase AcnA [Gemmatimonadales bacterium]|jgi:aconitate hydratase